MKLTIFKDMNCGVPFLARLELIRLFNWSLKLHIFLRSDADPELHDHPWGFWSLVLAGGYYEQVEDGVIVRKKWTLVYRPAEWRHRVILQDDCPCATLVLTRPASRDWGFYRDGKFIPWQKFKSFLKCE